MGPPKSPGKVFFKDLLQKSNLCRNLFLDFFGWNLVSYFWLAAQCCMSILHPWVQTFYPVLGLKSEGGSCTCGLLSHRGHRYLCECTTNCDQPSNDHPWIDQTWLADQPKWNFSIRFHCAVPQSSSHNGHRVRAREPRNSWGIQGRSTSVSLVDRGTC